MKGVWIWGALAVACVPSLIDHVARVWQLEQYHYLPALLLALALLVWQRWDHVWLSPAGLTSWSFLAVTAFMLVLGFLAGSSWVGALGTVFLVGAWLRTHRSATKHSLIHLWPPLFMLMPLPLGLDSSLTHWLQIWSSRVSSYALDFLEVPHALFGNVLRLDSGTLFVEEACSGVQSLYTVIFVAILIVAVLKRSVWLLPLYLLSAIFWAGAMNVTRIVAIAYAQHHYAYDLAHGWPHAILGYVCLAGACLLLLSTDRLLRVFAFPIESNTSTEVEPNPFVYFWNRSIGQSDSKIYSNSINVTRASPWVVRGLIGFSALALVGHTLRFMPHASAASTSAAKSTGRFLTVPDLLSDSVPGFAQVAHELVEGNIDQPMGEFADVWKGEYRGLPVTVALSQPYPEWHDLCVCYTGAGLNLNDRKVSDSKEKDWNFVTARFIADDGKVSYVWFSAFDAMCNPVNAPDSGIFTRWLGRFRSGDSLLKPAVSSSTFAIVQLKVDLEGFLPADSVDLLTDLHLQTRKMLSARNGQ